MTLVPPGACQCCTECTGELSFETVGSMSRVGMVLSGDVSANTIESVAHGFVAGDEVQFYATAAGGGLPAGLNVGTTYFVLASGLATDVFKVSLTSAGSAVNITGEGAALVRLDADAGTFTMHRQAWCLTDLSSLWEEPNQRGANIVIPGAPGRATLPRRPDETDYALPFIISGVVDEADALASDENEQLRLNMEFLRTGVLSPPAPPASTTPATLVSPDGGTMLTADVQFGSPPLVRRYKNSGLWIGTLHLVVPAGAFA